MDQLPPIARTSLPWLVFLNSALGIRHSLRKPRQLEYPGLDIASTLVDLLSFLHAPLVLVMGPKSAFSLLILFAQTLLFLQLNANVYQTQTNTSLPLHTFIVWAFFTIQYFFGTGHGYEFNKLHFAAAFVGFEEASIAGGFLLMTLDTCSSPIVFILALPLVVIWLSRNNGKHYSLLMF
jgi:phosphatidylinositol glycan class O